MGGARSKTDVLLQYANQDGTFNLSNDCKQKGIMVHLFDGKEPIYKSFI